MTMTHRQLDAIEWLESVGKAVPVTIKRHGFTQRTFDYLADAGYIRREYQRTRTGSFPIYRPLAETKEHTGKDT